MTLCLSLSLSYPVTAPVAELEGTTGRSLLGFPRDSIRGSHSAERHLAIEQTLFYLHTSLASYIPDNDGYGATNVTIFGTRNTHHIDRK